MAQLLTGTLRGENDRVVAAGVLKALGDYPCTEHDAMLFRLVTKPDEIRTTDSGSVTAVALREAAMHQVEQSASVSLREQLCQYVLGPSAAPKWGVVSKICSSVPIRTTSARNWFSTSGYWHEGTERRL